MWEPDVTSFLAPCLNVVRQGMMKNRIEQTYVQRRVRCAAVQYTFVPLFPSCERKERFRLTAVKQMLHKEIE